MFKNNKGSILIQVMVAAGILAALSPLIMRSSLLKGQLTIEEKQNLVIEETIGRANTVLSNSDLCKSAMDSGFTSVGNISPGVLNDQVNVSLSSISSTGFNGNGETQVLFSFSKETKDGGKSFQKSVSRNIRVKRFVKNETGETFCLSYVATGTFTSYQYFCDFFGGSWDSLSSQCDFSSLAGSFKDNFLFPYACEVLGGSFVSGSCSGVNINGPLSAPHFNSTAITLNSAATGKTRTSFQNTSCSGIQLGQKVNADSSLSCKNVNCPKPSTSDYSPIFVAAKNQIQCQCQRNSVLENPSLACGDKDPTSCSAYMADDGCGTSRLCQILPGLVCPPGKMCSKGKCVCKPDCSCLALSPSGCSNGCGGVCEGTPTPVTPPPSCTPDCSCADLTPVGQTCDDGCNGSCDGKKTSCSAQVNCSCASGINANSTCKGDDGCGESLTCKGLKCDYLDGYSKQGLDCLYRNYFSTTSTPGACSIYSDSTLPTPACKQIKNGTCSGSTGPTYENAANGTPCGGGNTCQSGNCVDPYPCSAPNTQTWSSCTGFLLDYNDTTGVAYYESTGTYIGNANFQCQANGSFVLNSGSTCNGGGEGAKATCSSSKNPFGKKYQVNGKSCRCCEAACIKGAWVCTQKACQGTHCP